MSKKILFGGVNVNQGLKDNDPTSIQSVASEIGLSSVKSLEDNPDLFLCADITRECMKIAKLAKLRSIKTVLINSEPSVVLPLQHKASTRALFDQVIEVGRPYSTPMIPWPQTWLGTSHLKRKDRQLRIVMVQSAKYSFVVGQQYGLRARVCSLDNRVDVVGFGWDESIARTLGRLAIEFLRSLYASARLDLSTMRTAFLRPLNYLGSVEDKIIAMSDYKVALVIENSSEYLTEKLFDSLFAGCIPVYVGPSLDNFGIPESLIVRAEPTISGVQEAITRALQLNHDAWLADAEVFLSDESNRLVWSGENVTKRVLGIALGNEN